MPPAATQTLAPSGVLPSVTTHGAAHVPLALCCVLFPLAMLAEEHWGLGTPRNTVDLAWAAWGLACLAALCVRPPASRPGLAAPALAALAGLAALARFLPQLSRADSAPLLMELKPLAYLLLAWLHLAAFPASRRSFRALLPRYAAALAVLLLAECVVASLAAGSLTRPFGSGEVNYDALLLCLGLAACFEEQASRTVRALIVLGIAASFSRTACLAAGLAVLLAAPLRPGARLAAAACLAGLGFAAFAVRGLPAAIESFDRVWMWRAGLGLLLAEPWPFFFGHAPGVPLPCEVPAALAALWTAQAGAWSAAGVHAFNFHAFFLRLALTWGLPASLASAWLMLRAGLGAGRSGRALAVMVPVFGLSMGLFYLGNVAVPLALAFAAARQGPDDVVGTGICTIPPA